MVKDEKSEAIESILEFLDWVVDHQRVEIYNPVEHPITEIRPILYF